MDGRCEAYGVGGIMRMPARLKISWQDDLTLKIETDAGQQTRLLQFAEPGAAAVHVGVAAQPRTLQGTSVAEWQRSGGAFDAFLERGAGAAPPRWGALESRRRRTCCPAGCAATACPTARTRRSPSTSRKVTNPEAGEWFVVTTVVDDPTYLAQQFVTSSNFKKEAERLEVESDAV